MNQEKKHQNLKITVNNLEKVSSKHTKILEALFRFTKIQMAHAERKDRKLHAIEVRLEKLENLVFELKKDKKNSSKIPN